MSLLHCVLGGFSLSVQMHGKPFPARGSHNTPFGLGCTQSIAFNHIRMFGIVVLVVM